MWRIWAWCYSHAGKNAKSLKSLHQSQNLHSNKEKNELFILSFLFASCLNLKKKIIKITWFMFVLCVYKAWQIHSNMQTKYSFDKKFRILSFHFHGLSFSFSFWFFFFFLNSHLRVWSPLFGLLIFLMPWTEMTDSAALLTLRIRNIAWVKVNEAHKFLSILYLMTQMWVIALKKLWNWKQRL